MVSQSNTVGWSEDPSRRHQLRYHDGVAYTQYVCDYGVVAVDTAPGDQFPPSNMPAAGEYAPRSSSPPEGAAPDAEFFSPPTGQGWAPPPFTAGTPQWGFPLPSPASQAVKRRRVGLWVAIAAASLEAVAIVALSLALIPSTSKAHTAHATTSKPIGSTVAPSGSFSASAGQLVYVSDFGTNEGWSTGTLNSNTTATVSNGQYVVQGWTTVHHPLLVPYVTPQRGLSVQTHATDYSTTTNLSVGTGCQSSSGISPALVYQMVVYPDGQWYIEEARIPGSVETLLSGQTTSLATAATVQLTCVITSTLSNTQTTQLVGYVNGFQVGAIGDEIDGTSVNGFIPILLLGSFGPKVSATFTDINVRSVSPPQAPQLQAQLQLHEARTGT
jgi:hypothetical protein